MYKEFCSTVKLWEDQVLLPKLSALYSTEKLYGKLKFQDLKQ